MKKFHKKLTILLFFATLIAFPVISFAAIYGEGRLGSFYLSMERREVKEMVIPSFKTFTDSTFQNGTNSKSGFSDYVNDRVYSRDFFVRLRNNSETILGKKEINGVFVIKNDAMFEKFSEYSHDKVAKNIEAFNYFAAAPENSEKPIYLLLAPTASEIYREKLPESADVISQKEFISDVYRKLQGISGIDALSALSANKTSYIYYRTDHHWTTLGALFAYHAAGATMGFEPKTLQSYNIVPALNDFRGTLFSKTIDKGIEPDVVSAFEPINSGKNVAFTTYNGAASVEYDTFYPIDFAKDTETVDGKPLKDDAYSYFFSVYYPAVKYTNNDLKFGENAKKLLLIHDSYANSFAPFLTSAYSEILALDLRQTGVGWKSYIENADFSDYDEVLLLYSVQNFTIDTNISYLRR